MELIYILLSMLFAIIISDILNKIFPKIPIIFIEIIMGILISFLPVFKEFELQPELFMIIIIKPLIFSEAQHVSIDELQENKSAIASLSVTLVIVTVLVTGLLINLIIPSIPLVLIFILAAMVIPTNVVFIKSISQNLQFPKGMLPILEGESLFNDSIAIVMFDFALAASVSGEFSIADSLGEFLLIVIGGIMAGFVLGFIIVKLRLRLIKKNFENPPMMVIIQLITPFVVYIIAEKYLHVSGILAVIIAGMVHIVEKPLLNLKSTKLQVISDSTWDVVEYVLEGLVTVILGISLPTVIKNLLRDNSSVFGYLLLISLLMYTIVIALRYLWIRINPKTFTLEKKDNISDRVYRWIFALSGVHGTITLAIALSLPSYIGHYILSRNELIFIATIVILISLIVPTIIFPMLLMKIEEDNTKYNLEDTRKKMINHTISELESNMTESDSNNINSVLRTLRGQLNILDEYESHIPDKNKIDKILNTTKNIEINAVDKMMNEKVISPFVGNFYKLYTHYYSRQSLKSILINIRKKLIKRKIKKAYIKSGYDKSDFGNEFMKEFKLVKSYVSKEVLAYLNENINNDNYLNMSFVIDYYNEKLSKADSTFDITHDAQVTKVYFSKAFDIEHTFVQDYLEKNLISYKVASELREQISYDEMVYTNKR